MGWPRRVPATAVRRWSVLVAMVAGVAAVYLVVVVGGGAVTGRTDQPSLVLSLVATAIVAMGFEPARAALSRRLNLSAYDQLFSLTTVLADTVAIEDVAPRLSRLLLEASRATVAEVWLRSSAGGDDHDVVARWPPTADPIRLDAPGVRRHPVRHERAVLGWLVTQERSHRPSEPAESRLVADLCAHAGLALRHVQLAGDLRRQIAESERRAAELRASRQRVVAVSDAERRRLERNIHDGAQQHLVALAISSGLVRSTLERDPDRAPALVPALRSAVTTTSRALVDLARGTYPAELSEAGVSAALRVATATSAIPVQVTDALQQRYPTETEVAAYFACSEAVQNAVKHSGGHRVRVRLAGSAEGIAVEVSDDGHGFDITARAAAAGTDNLRDRLDTVGGRAEITSTPAGTTVRAWVPCRPGGPAA